MNIERKFPIKATDATGLSLFLGECRARARTITPRIFSRERHMYPYASARAYIGTSQGRGKL